MITYEQEKNKKQREQENVEYKKGWKPWRCTHTHTHTSLLENKIKNKIDIEKRCRPSMIC